MIVLVAHFRPPFVCLVHTIRPALAWGHAGSTVVGLYTHPSVMIPIPPEYLFFCVYCALCCSFMPLMWPLQLCFNLCPLLCFRFFFWFLFPPF